MRRRYELPDEQWKVCLLPATGRPRRGDRTTPNDVFWKLFPRATSCDVPERYRKWHTIYDGLAGYRDDCTFEATFFRACN